MPTTTGRGFRIPLDTDPVADGALAVRNLGTDVNDNIGRIAAGSVSVQLTNQSTNTATFNVPVGRFINNQGNITVTCSTIFAGYIANVTSISTTQIGVRITRLDGTNVTNSVPVHLIAVQQ